MSLKKKKKAHWHHSLPEVSLVRIDYPSQFPSPVSMLSSHWQ